MSGPWGSEDPEAPKTAPGKRGIPGHRVLIWLALMAVLGGGVWLIRTAFPGYLDVNDWSFAARAFVILLMLSAAVLTARRIDWGQKARHAAIWAGIVAMMVLGLTYRDELIGVGERIRSEFSSSYPVTNGERQLVVTAAEGGGFLIMGTVNGQLVRFLVDTGASDTVLSPDDAARVGVNLASLHFDHMAETANGTGYGAPFTADSLTIGPIKVAAMPMVVNRAPMTSSLLGMTFLSRLDSFQVRGRRLYLKARD